MKIGMPEILIREKQGIKWCTFLEQLGCEIVFRDGTRREVRRSGQDRDSSYDRTIVDCVEALYGRCDRVFLAHFSGYDATGEFYDSFQRLPDIVHRAFPDLPVLMYDRTADEVVGFLTMGKELGKNVVESMVAYLIAVQAQRISDEVLLSGKKRAIEFSI